MTAATMPAVALDNAITPTMDTPVQVEKKAKKPKAIKQAVGGIVIDKSTNKILMLASRKAEGAYRLPRGTCEKDETPEQALIRILHDVAGVQVEGVSSRVGTYVEANKKGKTVGHHWMYEVTHPTLLKSDRQRVWFTIEEAIAASSDRNIARLALNNCSLSH